MKRGIDIINAMLRQSDALRAERAARSAEQQLAEAKAMFERDALAAGSRLIWVGDLRVVFVPIELLTEPCPRLYRVRCTRCPTSASVCAVDDDDARRRFRDKAWLCDDETVPSWRCPLCATPFEGVLGPVQG